MYFVRLNVTFYFDVLKVENVTQHTSLCASSLRVFTMNAAKFNIKPCLRCVSQSINSILNLYKLSMCFVCDCSV